MDAPYDINVQSQIDAGPDLPLARIWRAVDWVLRRHDLAPGTGLSVVIADDDTIRQLNRQFRAVDAPTDVLSFAADPVPAHAGKEAPYLGDLLLALPTLRRQAEAEGHALSDELALAVIHGALHLVGYDHDSPENQARMWAVQDEALRAMGISIVVPRFEFPGDKPVSGDVGSARSEE